MQKISRIIVISIVVLSFLILAPDTLAVTLSYSNVPSIISANPFTIEVTVEGPNPGTNYLRIDLYTEGSTNYFGETYNSSNWYKGSDYKQYVPITIGEDKIATTSVQARVGEPTASEYQGSGLYKLKVRRYTSSGNVNTSDEQTPATVNITVPLSSPPASPQVDPTLLPTPKPTNFPTPKASTTISKKTSPTPSKKPSPQPSSVVLGEAAASPSPGNSPSPEVSGKKGSGFPVGLLFIAGGLMFSGAAGFLFYKKMEQKTTRE